jgi:uncharacterized protein
MSEIKDDFDIQQIYNVIPKKVLKSIIEEYSLNLLSGMNGLNHWSRVLENALLLSEYNNANKNIIIAFSLFHKIKRNNEEHDQNEGIKSAEFLRYYEDQLNLTEEEFDETYLACKNISEYMFHENKNISTCWDAERLDLMRTGLYPKESNMNSDYAKNAGIITWSVKRALNNHISDWVYEMLEDLNIEH